MSKIKLTALVIALVLLAGTATAYNVGDTLTPSEFKEIDLTNYSFNIQSTGNKIITTGTGEKVFQYNYSYETFKQTSDFLNYEKRTEGSSATSSLTPYVNCRSNIITEIICKIKLKVSLLFEIISNRERTRYELMEEQARVAYSDEVSPGDIVITVQEMNAGVK